MRDTMFDELLASVEQADHFIKNEGMVNKSQVGRITEFAPLEVKVIRAKTGLSQQGFASVLGVSKRTLENWEQGRRQPTGPARVLLKIMDTDAEYVLKALHQN
ncbi:helix-turn-helix domain-containing protein [Marinomonas agarivorans]|nr:helix-turn-helix domain-containing protein [Marinomonas agarivorans]